MRQALLSWFAATPPCRYAAVWHVVLWLHGYFRMAGSSALRAALPASCGCGIRRPRAPITVTKHLHNTDAHKRKEWTARLPGAPRRLSRSQAPRRAFFTQLRVGERWALILNAYTTSQIWTRLHRGAFRSVSGSLCTPCRLTSRTRLSSPAGYVMRLMQRQSAGD